VDLYDFIGNEFSRPSQGKTEEASTGFQTRRESLTTEQQEKISALEKHVEALKSQQTDTEARMRAYSEDKENALREANGLLKSRTSEIERLRADISALQLKLSEKLANCESEKQTCLDELETVRKDFSAFKQITKIAAVIICIVALAVVTGSLGYCTKNTANKPTQAAAPVATPAGTVDNVTGNGLPAAAEWPGKPFPVNVGNFRISLAPLKADAVKKLSTSLKQGEAQTRFFYMVRISAPKSDLSGEFLKSPSIDFIDGSNTSSHQTEAGIRVVHLSHDGMSNAKKDTVLFECVVSVRKDFQPAGIIIRHPNKEILKIILY
jgi:hypothetical protein